MSFMVLFAFTVAVVLFMMAVVIFFATWGPKQGAAAIRVFGTVGWFVFCVGTAQLLNLIR